MYSSVYRSHPNSSILARMGMAYMTTMMMMVVINHERIHLKNVVYELIKFIRTLFIVNVVAHNKTKTQKQSAMICILATKQQPNQHKTLLSLSVAHNYYNWRTKNTTKWKSFTSFCRFFLRKDTETINNAQQLSAILFKWDDLHVNDVSTHTQSYKTQEKWIKTCAES